MTAVNPVTASFFLQIQSDSFCARVDHAVTELLATRCATIEQITDHVASRRGIARRGLRGLATEFVLGSLYRLCCDNAVTLDLGNDGVFVYRLA